MGDLAPRRQRVHTEDRHALRQVGIKPRGELLGRDGLAQEDRRPFSAAGHAHGQGPAEGYLRQRMVAGGKAGLEPAPAQGALEKARQFELAQIHGAADLGVPDAQMDGLDGQVLARRGRRRGDGVVFTGLAVEPWADVACSGRIQARFAAAEGTDAAARAVAVAAIGRRCSTQSLFALAAQKAGRHAAGKMVPGQGRVRVARAKPLRRIEAGGLKDAQPRGEVEAVHPGAKKRALAVGGFDKRRELPAGAGEYALEKAHFRLVPAQRQPLVRGKKRTQPPHPLADGLHPDLRFPLERRVGLGHEGRDGGRDLQPFRAGRGRGQHLFRQVENAFHVLVGFRGQADHEIELHLLPAVGEQPCRVFEDVLFADALVDDVAQTLGRGFRSHGRPGAADAGHHRKDGIGQRAGAQRRQGHGHLLPAAAVDAAGKKTLQGREIARGQGKKRQLLVAGAGKPVRDEAFEHAQAAFAHGAVDHAGMAEAAAARAAPGDLHGQAVVHGLGEGHDLAGGKRRGVEIGQDGFLHPVVAGNQGARRAVRTGREKIRHVDALDGNQAREQVAAGNALPARGDHGLEDGGQDLFAVADDHGVEKRGHGFGVERATAAGDDQRPPLAPVGGAEGNAGEVEHVQDVGVTELVGDVERQHVAGRKGRVGLQGAKGRALFAQQRGGFVGGGEDPLGGEPLHAVDGFVEDAPAHVGHADLVHIGKGQGDAGPDAGRVLGRAAPFRAQVLGGFLQVGDEFTHGCSGRRQKPRRGVKKVEAGGLPRRGPGEEKRAGRYFLRRLEMLPPLPARLDNVLRSPEVESVRLLVASR